MSLVLVVNLKTFTETKSKFKITYNILLILKFNSYNFLSNASCLAQNVFYYILFN